MKLIPLFEKYFRLDVGLREDLMGWDVHEGDGLAHYARACTDITFRFPFGVQELMGIAARGNFDLTQHTEGSGKSKSNVAYFHLKKFSLRSHSYVLFTKIVFDST